MQSTHACIFARFTRKMHGWLKGWWGDRAAKSGDWTCKERMRYLKQIWIAYHALGMTAMLQLCYHKGASMAGSKNVSLHICSFHSQNAHLPSRVQKHGQLGSFPS